MGANSNHETALLAGGCYWCLEAVFERLRGVESVVSGFVGGHVADPDYRQVCEGSTGHAEAIQVTFDPGVVSYRELLEMFFAFHDPTTLDRQGPDVGTQYRSAIFPLDERQRATAADVMAQLTRDGVFSAPIVTSIEEPGQFHRAHEDHQGYYRANPGQPYCRAMIAPKVAKLRARYADRLKPESAPAS